MVKSSKISKHSNFLIGACKFLAFIHSNRLFSELMDFSFVIFNLHTLSEIQVNANKIKLLSYPK